MRLSQRPGLKKTLGGPEVVLLGDELLVVRELRSSLSLHAKVQYNTDQVQALEVDGRVGLHFGLQEAGDVGDVVPGVGLSCEVHLASFELWVSFKEALDEDVEVGRYLALAEDVVLLLAFVETDADRLVYVDHVG